MLRSAPRHVVQLALVVAATLLATARAAQATGLDDTTIGVEWEYSYGWGVHSTDLGKNIKTLLADKKILCSADTVPGNVANETFPLLAVTYDLGGETWDATLEIVTGPLSVKGDAEKWTLVNELLEQFNAALAKRYKHPCEGETCFVSAKDLLSELGAKWKYCDANPRPDTLGFNAVASRDSVFSTPDHFNTQINVKMDMDAIFYADVMSLFSKQNRVANAARDEILGDDDDSETYTMIEDIVFALLQAEHVPVHLEAIVGGYLTWYIYSLNAFSFTHVHPWEHKNDFPIFPKAPLHTIFALLDEPTKTHIRNILGQPTSKAAKLCLFKDGGRKCNKFDTFVWSDVIARDLFDVGSISVAIQPTKSVRPPLPPPRPSMKGTPETTSALIVAEARDKGNPFTPLLAPKFLQKKIEVAVADRKAVAKALREAGVLK